MLHNTERANTTPALVERPLQHKLGKAQTSARFGLCTRFHSAMCTRPGVGMATTGQTLLALHVSPRLEGKAVFHCSLSSRAVGGCATTGVFKGKRLVVVYPRQELVRPAAVDRPKSNRRRVLKSRFVIPALPRSWMYKTLNIVRRVLTVTSTLTARRAREREKESDTHAPESGHVLHGGLVVLVLDESRRLEVQDLL